MTVALSSLHLTPAKTAGEDNFPVGSWLLPAAIRPNVHAFYRFARAADDIADDPVLSPEQKLSRLFALDPALLGRGAPYARRLIAAFKCDAVRNRTPDWQDLVDYCTLSAVPVGRFLLDLHGEGEAAHGPCDALCVALQVLNHIQDLGIDRARLNRVYLPLDWLAEAGTSVDAIDDSTTGPQLRQVIDRALDQVDLLLVEAARLPHVARGLRLRLEATLVLFIARRLSHKLRHSDPLAIAALKRNRPDHMACTFCGMIRGLMGR